MRVRKESGGTTVTWGNIAYEWPEDGSVTDVPAEFGAELLSIRGGGYTEILAPEVITEPAAAAEITEPGPAADITEGSPEQETAKPDRGGKRAKSDSTPEA